MARSASPTKPAADTSTPTSANGHATNGNGNGHGNGTKKGTGYRQLTAGETQTWTGLTIERRFTRPDVHPYDTVEWDTREAIITNEHGEAVFEQKDLEIPKAWSQLATQVVASKYFRGHLGTPERERSAKQMIDRVADTIADWGIKDAYFATDEDAEAFRNELKDILLKQRASFNSPVWFNVGIDAHPQCSAPASSTRVDDTMESILTLAKTEGMLFKFGSGAGSNLSTIRSSKETLRGGGEASGPVSFMKGFDAFAGVIKSGGKTRRAAKMVILNVGHPDVEEFIDCKLEEEKKAWALIDAGYDGNFNGGAAYASVFFQNSNNSVRVTDEFMEAVENDADWTTHAITTGEPVETVKARYLLKKMAEAAWVCGDPGIQYHDNINRWHTSANTAPINASNPCSEYMYLDDSRLQPGEPEPHEVRQGRRRVRHRGLQARGADRVHRAGDHRRQRELPDAAHRRELARLPADRPGLRQPRRAAHEPRPGLRLRWRPRLRGGDHGAHAGGGGAPVSPHQPRPGRPVRRLRGQPRAVPEGHAPAPRRGVSDRREAGARRPARRHDPGLGRGRRPRREDRLPQRAAVRPGADRHHRLHDGLRHDRR